MKLMRESLNVEDERGLERIKRGCGGLWKGNYKNVMFLSIGGRAFHKWNPHFPRLLNSC